MMKHKLIQLAALALLLVLYSACEKPFAYSPDEIPQDFVGLDAPQVGEGFQIHIPAFPVPPNFEREWFMRMAFGNTEEMFVNRFTSRCRPGTHHLIAYGFEEESKYEAELPPIGLMRDQNRADGRANIRGNMSGDLAYFISQNADFELAFPPGIAIRIPANATVDMNSHYFNKTDKTLFGEVYLNAFTMEEAEVTEVLNIDQVDNDEFLYLPPNKTTTVSYTDIFQRPKNLRLMLSHMHKRGKNFEVYMVGGPRDGELLYKATDYQHPPTLFFESEPLAIPAGQGLRTEVTYVNETNRTIEFGVTSEDEMGILFYMYSTP